MSVEQGHERPAAFLDTGPLREGSSDYKEMRTLVHKDVPKMFGEHLLHEKKRLQERYASAVECVRAQQTVVENEPDDIVDLEVTIVRLEHSLREKEATYHQCEDSERQHQEDKKTAERALSDLSDSWWGFGRLRFLARAKLETARQASVVLESKEHGRLDEFARQVRDERASLRLARRQLATAQDRLRQCESDVSSAQENVLTMQRELETFLQGKDGSYSDALTQFLEQTKDPDIRDQLSVVLAEAKKDDHLQQRLFANLEFGFIDRSEIGAVARALREKHDPEVFFRIIELYHVEFKKRQKEFEQEKEKIINDFLLSVEEAVAAGWLPVNMDRIRRRASETMIRFADALGTSMNAGHSGIWRIDISSKIPREEWRHTLFHELVHQAIAGRELHVGSYHGGVMKRPLFRRSGLRVMEYSEIGDVIGVQYLPTNEAITEKITLRLLNDPKEELGNYSFEREKLDRIVDTDNLETQMLDAYCEDEDVDAPEEGRNNKWAAFIGIRDWDIDVREF